MFIIKNRLRFAPGIVFNQPVGEGGGSGEPQGGDPKSGEPQGGDPKSGEPQGGDPKSGDYKAPWDKSGEPFDEARARKLLAARDADEQKMRERLAELEAAQNAADEAKGTAQEAALDAARLRAAIKHGLSEEDLEFIHGKTTEEVLASAERYAERHKSDDKGDPKGPPSRRPLTGRGGGNPASEPEEMDPAKLAASIPNLH